LLNIEELDVFYGDMQAVRKASLRVEEREIITLVGANGAGKSTLIRAITGLIPIQNGKIEFLGKRIDSQASHDIVGLGIVQVPEARRIFPFMSTFENLLVAQTKRAKKRREEILSWVYQLFPVLKERKDQMAGSLSGGEQQMLAIGRGLMAAPQLLMLDEPSLGLAPLLVRQIFQIIQQINQNGVTILLVEQNVMRALSLANRGYVLENGAVTMEGRGKDLLESEYLKKAYLAM
jgi:branched-chain amino acid transport system ATP-binding protein